MDGRHRTTPLFLAGPSGSLFGLHHVPVDGEPRGAVLYVHPFAEEMNRSRRMAALQCRALADRGYAVLQIDLTGCGDSGGDFGDASWETWLEDIAFAGRWLMERNAVPISLFGLRTGALLAAESALRFDRLGNLLLWQPVVDGERFLNQFLRIQLAAEAASEPSAAPGLKNIKADLAAGSAVEVAGYMLSPALARQLAGRKLLDFLPPCPCHWFELSDSPGDPSRPETQRAVQAWRDAGMAIDLHRVAGAPFWTTQELVENPELIRATSEAMAT